MFHSSKISDWSVEIRVLDGPRFTSGSCQEWTSNQLCKSKLLSEQVKVRG